LLRQKSPGTTVRTESHALLKGILRCQPCSFAMTPAFTSKNAGQRYRFYSCVNALKRGRHVCPSRYLPALDIEKMVVEQIRELAKGNPTLSGTNDTIAPFRDLSAWESLAAAEQARLVQRWVQRVEYDGREGKVSITFHALDDQNSNGEQAL
jgi:Recombinase zinc beta ribbon domain